jgi:kynurenine 3-monooxygenase
VSGAGAPITGEVAIVGAGPTGAMLAILLRRRGMNIAVYESRADPRAAEGEAGRSINLALADRGINALKRIGVYEEVRRETVPMRGRLIHEPGGGTTLLPYGRRSDEVIYSISRRRLNQVLIDIAVRRHGVPVKFEHRLESVDLGANVARIRDLGADRLRQVPMQPLLACDGAGSLLRRELAQIRVIEADERLLTHGYKELSIPAGIESGRRLARDVLHIWPRGGYMLIALPNLDGSFTATLFLDQSSFASLTEPAAIERFLAESFPDVLDLMPEHTAEFLNHPTGSLGTVHAAPWHYGDTAALIGDSAHAIVPFHGQGMNCCFEDCLEFDAAVGRHDTWEARFDDFYRARKPNTEAIAAMALDNYLEMRERVADPGFRLQQSLSLELERRFPARFVPRYAMVMFHHEIPYAVALRRGEFQSRLLQDLTAGATSLRDIDFDQARREIERHLAPIHSASIDGASASVEGDERIGD